MHELPKGRRPPGLLRTVLKRDLKGRPVKTAPFARQRQALSEASSPNSDDRLKAAILLGAQMAVSEARFMLARKARQVRLSSPRKKPE